MNAVEIEQAISELALQPFDAAEFPFTFLAAFGNKDITLKRLRTGNNNASDTPGGVLLRNNIHLGVCDAGTVGGTLKWLRATLATMKAKAKFILATDGHPRLEHPEIIKMDYGMTDGSIRMRVHAAVARYMLLRRSVDCTPNHRLEKEQYRLWLSDPLALYGVQNAKLAPGYQASSSPKKR